MKHSVTPTQFVTMPHITFIDKAVTAEQKDDVSQ
jgi:hypothetical protein